MADKHEAGVEEAQLAAGLEGYRPDVISANSTAEEPELTDEEFKWLIRETPTPQERFLIRRIIKQRQEITVLQSRLEAIEHEVSRWQEIAHQPAEQRYQDLYDSTHAEIVDLALRLEASEQRVNVLEGWKEGALEGAEAARREVAFYKDALEASEAERR